MNPYEFRDSVSSSVVHLSVGHTTFLMLSDCFAKVNFKGILEP